MYKGKILFAGVLVLLIASVLIVADDDTYADVPMELYGIEGTGTSLDPYLVDSAEDLTTINSLSSSMLNGTSINVRLVNDVDISELNEIDSSGAIISSFRGVFDGNGYSIEGTNTAASFLFYYTHADTVISNLVLNTGSQMILVFLLNDGHLLMSDVTVEGNGVGTMDNTNYSPFIAHCFADLTMERCINNADLVLGRYGAVFLGGYVRDGADISFIDCVNNGNITGVYASLFIGNTSNTHIGTLMITGCQNNGVISGTPEAGYVCAWANDMSTVFNTINNACKSEGLSSGSGLKEDGAQVDSYSIEKIEGTGTMSSNDSVPTINISGEVTTSDPNASYAIFSIGTYASGNGTWMTTVYGDRVEISNSSAKMDLKIGMMTTLELAMTQYGVSVDDAEANGTTGNGFQWYSFDIGDATIYAVDFCGTEWTLNNDTSVTLAVTLYNSSGVPIGYASTNVTVTAPSNTETYYKVFVGSEGLFDIVADSRFVKSGDSFSFSIISGEGYIVGDNPSVIAGNSTNSSSSGYTSYNVVSNSDGSYTISNVTSNVYITLSSGDVTPITYSVSYVLDNVTSTSETTELGYGSSFATTVSPMSGYVLNDVTVYMGGVEVPGAYDSSTGKINIGNVTGDLTIVASAGIVPPIWDDDDDYVPPVYVPEQDSSDDDTVTIVACAAAAVVAAILAVFLIVERKH